MKMKLSNLLGILRPLLDQCNDELAIDVEVIPIESNEIRKKYLLLKAINQAHNSNLQIPDASQSNPYFKVTFTFQGDESNLSISHIFYLDLSEIKNQLLRMNKNPDKANVRNIIAVISSFQYEDFIKLLKTFNGANTNHIEIANLLSNSEGVTALYNLGL